MNETDKNREAIEYVNAVKMNEPFKLSFLDPDRDLVDFYNAIDCDAEETVKDLA